jgi:V/A-type H+/Na+-transporting ATPase subunit D
MSVAKASPTRITLLAKKREMKIATRGHKLLKDKQDGLMREFMARIHEAHALRKELHTLLHAVFRTYVSAATLLSPSHLRAILALHTPRTEIATHTRHVMAVAIPSFTLKQASNATRQNDDSTLRSFGFLETYGNIDKAQTMVTPALPLIIALAAVESAVHRLADEIERTRRRASALEHIRIPKLHTTIRDITLRLEEQNRDAVVSSMRVKALIQKK